MRYYRPFRDVIPRSKAGHPRVTHPFATLLTPCGAFAFDLHVLGTPPALILSQDQTLMLNSLAPVSCSASGLAGSLHSRGPKAPLRSARLTRDRSPRKQEHNSNNAR